MNLGIDDIVPEALHGKVGWDMRHHFMAESSIDLVSNCHGTANWFASWWSSTCWEG
jgi:hypothetical protein